MIKNIIFDLGNVLIDWNPRYIYRNIFLNEPEEMEFFLSNVCTSTWNSELDIGKPFDLAVQELKKKYPQYTDQIVAYKEQWHEMIRGTLDETVEILKALKSNNFDCFALSNWSHETFEPTRKKFNFFKYFDGMVISGYENIIKPDPKIYQLLLNRYSLKADECLFIDDLEKNILAGQKEGIRGIIFKTPQQLKKDLQQMSLLS